MNDMGTRISTLWIVVMFNIAFADIVGFIQPGALQGVSGPGGVQITQGLLLVFAVLLEIPIAMIFAVPHLEAGGQPLGEHCCGCDHHRVRGGRRVDGAPLLRVLRSRGSRVHGADRLVRLGAAQLRSRDVSSGGPVGRTGIERTSEDTMKAVIQTGYGSADVMELKELEKPTPGDGEVLVRVVAASLAAGEYFGMRGKPFPIRFYIGFPTPKKDFVVGLDCAGVVEAVGPNVSRFQPGDEVYGECHGSCAEYAVAEEGRLAPKPAQPVTSSRPRPCPRPPAPLCRRCAIKARSSPATRCSSTAHPGVWGRSPCRSPRRSAPK